MSAINKIEIKIHVVYKKMFIYINTQRENNMDRGDCNLAQLSLYGEKLLLELPDEVRYYKKTKFKHLSSEIVRIEQNSNISA